MNRLANNPDQTPIRSVPPALPPLKIAVAGLGTVGVATLNLLRQKSNWLALRAGRHLEVVAVSARQRHKKRDCQLDGLRWYDDPVKMAKEGVADCVVELIGGADSIAADVVREALENGRDVVTANKALLATHGASLARKAENAQCQLRFEAAVAGGIPIVKALREGLVANQITHLHGILNGTSNYILTSMQQQPGLSFGDILAKAQAEGYAEADPSFDIEGTDAAHKLALLSALAFGRVPTMQGMRIRGIEGIEQEDFAYARDLGMEIKLLGLAELCANGAVYQEVAPLMVSKDAPIAAVNGVFNGIVCRGDAVGDSLYEGRGAGGGPTASAVVADLVDIALGRASPIFGMKLEDLSQDPLAERRDKFSRYYLRLRVKDEPGVVADVAAILRDESISLDVILQRARHHAGGVNLVITTHQADSMAIEGAVRSIAKLPSVIDKPQIIRIEAA